MVKIKNNEGSSVLIYSLFEYFPRDIVTSLVGEYYSTDDEKLKGNLEELERLCEKGEITAGITRDVCRMFEKDQKIRDVFVDTVLEGFDNLEINNKSRAYIDATF